jgi:phage gp29-like protein
MKGHPYEYKVLVEYISPEEMGRYPHFSHLEDQEGLTKTLNEVFQHLAGSIPKGWEVNSHNITVSRSTLIITVLLRRPSTG